MTRDGSKSRSLGGAKHGSLGLGDWVLGARPKTLILSVIPVLMASAVYVQETRTLYLGKLMLLIIMSLGFQVSVNYANDYADGIKGTDKNRIGPIRLVASGRKPAKHVQMAAIILTVICVIIGLILSALSSWWLILFGIGAVLATWGYTSTSWAYGYKGFAEVMVILFFGLIPSIGSYVVFVGSFSVPWLIYLLGALSGLLSAIVSLINNMRDIKTDKEEGKNTLVVKLGLANSKKLFYLFFFSIALATVVVGTKYLFVFCALAVFIFLPNILISLKDNVWREVFGQSIKFVSIYSLFVIVGVLVS